MSTIPVTYAPNAERLFLAADARYGIAERDRDGVWTSMTINCGYVTLSEAMARCEGRDDLRPWDRHHGSPDRRVSETSHLPSWRSVTMTS